MGGGVKHHIAALIPAAGSGVRMGGAVAKPYLHLGNREIVARTLAVFEGCAAIDEVWLIVAAEQRDYCQRAIVERYGLRKVRGIVAGGRERQESVWRGFQRLTASVDLVVVHDGVRPFVTSEMVCRALQGAVLHGAAVTAVPVKDTLKRVSEAGMVETTISRERLWRTQTPQAFRRVVLQEAFQYALTHGLSATDEAGLVEAAGHPVHVVLGTERNIKITTPDDLQLGERFLNLVD
jgi:2-C-methyl-D-erythritol 4-phosphate cytidylyltransferase